MPNAMHNDWLKAKTELEKQVDTVKKNGGLNPKQIQDALKSFTGGLGPLLEDVGKAFKSNKGDDVVKAAAKAKKVAEDYLKTVTAISNERGGYAKIQLKTIITKLDALHSKGMQCREGKMWLGV